MKPSVMICVPAYGQSVTAQTMESLFMVGQLLTLKGIRHQLSWFSGSDIVEIRNLFLTNWYDNFPQYSHLLFVDADMGFPPELIRDMIKFDKPLTGVFYAKRSMDISVVGGALKDDHSIRDVVNGFIPASYVGGGVMLISRTVVDRMIEKIPGIIDVLPPVMVKATPFKMLRWLRCFDPILQKDRRLSEDVSFCTRWKGVGGEIWANINHKISHVGPFDFHLRYQGILEAKAKQEEIDAKSNEAA